MMEFWSAQSARQTDSASLPSGMFDEWMKGALPEPIAQLGEAQQRFWSDSFALWQRLLDPHATDTPAAADRDPRFSDPQWREGLRSAGLNNARRFDWAELLPGLLRDLALEPG